MSTRHKAVTWLIASCLLAVHAAPAQRTVYVSLSGGHSEPYTSWPAAATNIQDALNIATNGDVVQLSNDVFTSSGAYASNAFVCITNAVVLRGFGPTPTNTIIDGGAPGVTNTGVFVNNTGAALQQLWVRNGFAVETNSAGGVYLQNGTISNCWITDCENTNTGAGGVYMLNAAQMTHSVVSNNINSRVPGTVAPFLWYNMSQAGGVQMPATARINDSFIVNNRQTGGCIIGGIYVTSAGGVFSNCNISYNYGNQRHGGVVGSNLRLYNCTLFSNTTIGVGGAVETSGSSVFEYCRFIGNTATRGGAIDLSAAATITIRNCLFYGNRATSAGLGGGAVESRPDSRVIVESSTIVSNSTAGQGGGLRLSSSTNNIFRNTIIYANAAGTAGDDIYLTYEDASSSNTLEYCCINSNLAFAAGLVTNNPQLKGMDVGDCRLDMGSPCLNSGANAAWMAGAADLDGRRRIDGFFQRVDIGAYEDLRSGFMLKLR